ncbi:hypothetical protein ACHQM5_029423 [Ranunculus cassubicifolius]
MSDVLGLTVNVELSRQLVDDITIFEPVSDALSGCQSSDLGAALTCTVRPTSAITWLYVGLLELYETKDRLRFIFLEVTSIGITVLALTCVLDRWLYQSWTFVTLNFLKFNFLSSGGDYYGTHKWHWYFTQGLKDWSVPSQIVVLFGSQETQVKELLDCFLSER